ncbi:endonuclease domain-containing protein [candidate division WOR-3 bacterium]|nr:endonuclease domain-containing protein [candidate division WOR-3 bacterium]
MEKRYLPPEILKRCRELRSSQTPAELKLWTCLRNKQLFGFKFRRQHPIGKFIVDFYCHEAKLAIELDGGGHTEPAQAKYDNERTDSLEVEGIRILRFWNTDVLGNLEGVIETIAEALPHPGTEGADPLP